MSFTQEERINISKTIIGIPDQIAELDKTSQAIALSQQALLDKDNLIKNLLTPKNTLILYYHNEIKYINGQDRVNIQESDIQNSAKKEPLNIFFPADQSFPTTSVPTGVWKYYTPFMMSGAIGKNRSESYNMVSDYELSKIPSIISSIDLFVSTYTAIRRTTGQGCVTGVPPSPDTISTDVSIVNGLNSIITSVNSLKTLLQSEKVVLNNNLDTDPTRVSDKIATLNSIDLLISAINTWLSYPNFNTSHGQTTCINFDAYNAALLAPTKGYDTQIQALRSALQTRQSYCSTRINQINSYLGVVIQDIATGDMITTTGFYGDRAKIIDLRLNLLGGSLMVYLASLNSSGAVAQQKKTAQNTQDVYSSVLKTTKLKAPSNGTTFIHVIDVSGFSVGQTVYIVANSQKEITLTIEQINGTMIKVDKNIPPTYRPSDGARLYVDLS